MDGYPSAVKSDCHDRTIGGTCRCRPKCVICGWGPHMAVHLGSLEYPDRAFDHEYAPPTDRRTPEKAE